MLEHLDALAEASAKAISNIKFDKVVVWEGGGNGNGDRRTRPPSCRDMARTMPPMLQVMKDIGGVEMPEYLAKLQADGQSAKVEPTVNGHTAKAEAKA